MCNMDLILVLIMAFPLLRWYYFVTCNRGRQLWGSRTHPEGCCTTSWNASAWVASPYASSRGPPQCLIAGFLTPLPEIEWQMVQEILFSMINAQSCESTASRQQKWLALPPTRTQATVTFISCDGSVYVSLNQRFPTYNVPNLPPPSTLISST